MTELTNQQIENAKAALEAWNPAASFRTKMRLSRNLQKLLSAFQSKEHDAQRLKLSVIKDKNHRPEPGKPPMLTPDEMVAFQEEYEKLMDEKQSVEIHPIPLFDGSVTSDRPDPGIDIAAIAVPNEILSRLIDVVLTSE